MTTTNGSAISTLIREIFVAEQAQIAAGLHRQEPVTPQQAVVLQLIDQRPGLIQKDIVALMQRRAATVSTFLKKLETAGYITRQIPEDNTRNKQLFLTNRGQAVVAAFQTTRTDVYQRLAANLSAAQQAELVTLLTTAQAGLED